MKNSRLKRYLAVMLSAFMCAAMAASCGADSAADEEEEEVYYQTLTIEDEDYYTRFKGKGVSINVYNWGEYICAGEDEGALDVLTEFEELTGITVNYTTFATNEELYAKLKGGGVSYDVIIPSDYMVSKMIKEGMVQKLDFDNIPNFKYIMDDFRDQAYDPKNEYSVPYTWGTVGIIYDETVIDIPEEEIDWDILWNEDYADQILMFDNPRDAFAIAEIMCGFSLNTEDPEELATAADKLKKQKNIVQGYVMDEIFDKMGAGEALIAPYYAGDAITIMEDNDALNFVVPASGTNLFIDAMCIPSSAANKEAAEMFINFMCEPDIAFANIDYICYSTPHSAAYEMLDDEVKADEACYPSDEVKANMSVFINLSDEANKTMQDLWTEMKSAEEDGANRWFVPIFLVLCMLTIIIVLVRRHIKNKKDIF